METVPQCQDYLALARRSQAPTGGLTPAAHSRCRLARHGLAN